MPFEGKSLLRGSAVAVRFYGKEGMRSPIQLGGGVHIAQVCTSNEGRRRR